MPGMFKMVPGHVGQGAMGTSRIFGMQKSTNSNNPMLLSVGYLILNLKIKKSLEYKSLNPY